MTARRALAVAMAGTLALGAWPAAAQTRTAPVPAVAVDRPPVPQATSGDVEVYTAGGYARLVFTFKTPTEVRTRTTGSVLVIGFERRVQVDANAIQRALGAYASAVRLDPDGKTMRLGLMRRLTINTMEAGEKVFVDLLPDSWTGLPPSLPKAVVDELVRRATEAERKLRANPANRPAELPEVGLRIGTAATFTRFVFSPPKGTPVSLDRKDNIVALTFLTAARFSPERWRDGLPDSVTDLAVAPDPRRLVVAMTVAKDIEVRGFVEGDDYVVDVSSPREVAPVRIVAPVAMPMPAAMPAATPAAIAAPPPMPQAAPAAPAPAPAPQPVAETPDVGSSRVDLQACKLEYSIVSPK